MTTLYLVRHGETIDNVRQIMQGQTQGELTENGILQARQVAEELKDVDYPENREA
jgi:probable phosphoglycerate mutase